jgi:diguanylate cyclase (GGDEF)-like protein/PAS domain S-box-containing protein
MNNSNIEIERPKITRIDIENNQSFQLKDCLLDLLLQNTSNLVIISDLTGKLLSLNTSLPFDFKGHDLTGRSIFDIYDPLTAKQIIEEIQSITISGDNITLETYIVLQGMKFWFYNQMGPIRNASGQIMAVIIIGIDISVRKETEERIQSLIFHDTVTGLYNRIYLDDQLKEIEKSQESFCIIVGDLNGLKSVNDTYGHKAGDKLLAKSARILASVSRVGDIVARSGGDEFVIIMPNCDVKYAQDLCRRIKRKFANAARRKLPLSIALGYAAKDSALKSIQEIFKEADARMYLNKLLERKSSYGTLFTSLQNTLYEKSQETEEHAERIKILALKMGRSLKLPLHELDNLSLLATLHDIGKIAIPEEILFKAGPLTASEFKVIQTHSEIGFRIASTNIHLLQVAEGILAHHERWDGNGYPRGLKGVEIPLISRIIAIADSYDAMTQNRVYHKAIDPSVALDEIAKAAGTQFDPNLVQTFLKLFFDDLYQI